MSERQTVTVGQEFLSLSAVAGAHWERDKLFVYLEGGRFMSFSGTDAHLVWSAITEGSVDLRTGEVKA